MHMRNGRSPVDEQYACPCVVLGVVTRPAFSLDHTLSLLHVCAFVDLGRTCLRFAVLCGLMAVACWNSCNDSWIFPAQPRKATHSRQSVKSKRHVRHRRARSHTRDARKQQCLAQCSHARLQQTPVCRAAVPLSATPCASRPESSSASSTPIVQAICGPRAAAIPMLAPGSAALREVQGSQGAGPSWPRHTPFPTMCASGAACSVQAVTAITASGGPEAGAARSARCPEVLLWVPAVCSNGHTPTRHTSMPHDKRLDINSVLA